MKVTVEVNDKIVVTSVEEGEGPRNVILMIGGQVVQVDGGDLVTAIERCQYAENCISSSRRRREF